MAQISLIPSLSGSDNRTTSPCFPPGHISLFGKHANCMKPSNRKIELPVPDEDPHHLVDTREHARSTTRSRSPGTSAHCFFYEFKVSKDSAHTFVWNNTLLTERTQVPPGSRCRVMDCMQTPIAVGADPSSQPHSLCGQM